MNNFQNARIIGDNVSSELYRANFSRGNGQFVMSRSELQEFDNCPSRWLKGVEGDDTDATLWGTLIDCLITSSESFEAHFVINPPTYPAEVKGVEVFKPWNLNATYCKQWERAAEDDGKTVIKPATYQAAVKAAEILKADQKIQELLQCSKRQVMVTAEYHDEDTGIVVLVKVLLDLVPDLNHPEFGKCIADLKTCRNGHFRAWPRQVFAGWYHVQAALGLDIYSAATGEDRNTWLHPLQENFAPFEPGRRMLSVEFIELGRRTYLASLKRYCRCLESGDWPGYDDEERPGVLNVGGWNVVDPEPWMLDLKAPRPIEEETDSPTSKQPDEMEVDLIP